MNHALLLSDIFYTAKDLDPVRFRASEEINQIIHKLAREKGIGFHTDAWYFRNEFG